ncbi:LamB/YcsF family protein [Millisia brevis]|uniref:LamB/YcsF family protein n=1 Tax=Millisia brevis TaxID=264148 RepID=UPI0008319F58|nr:5-oxoprolinase subunit PxpA [Millisia brevis]
MTIDLNSDMGEGFGQWSMGDDAAMLEVVSSANVACGFHAGDPAIMQDTCTGAVRNGVAIGAHIAYRDLAGFGRRTIDVDSRDLVAEAMYQIGALTAIAASAGGSVTYVKPHGALYNTIVHDERQARDVVEAIRGVDDSLALLGLPGSAVLKVAEHAGLRVVREAFADRAYTPAGTLVSRREAGAVLHDPDLVAERIVRLVEDGVVEAIDGSIVRLEADSICVHGDSPGAVEMATAVRTRLTDNGIGIAPFAS